MIHTINVKQEKISPTSNINSFYLKNKKNVSVGDQRHVFIQLVLNKRRRRRSGRKENQYTLTTWERVVYVLKNGKINDYIHPREIDPYWGILYKQYEYLTYLEKLYKYEISKSDIIFSDNEIVENMKICILLEKYKKELLFYMSNFMNLLYGSVLKNRFYGWTKKYAEEFISLFTFLIFKNLNELKFDINRTRCSVYFYQLLWLGGLGLTKEISERLTRERTKGEDGNRGITIFSDESFESRFNDDENGEFDIDSWLEISKESEHSVAGVIDECNVVEEHVEFNEYSIDGRSNTDKKIICFYDDIDVNDDNPEQLTIKVVEENENQHTLHTMLERLLYKLDIPLDWIYNAGDKDIKKIGKHIRKSLKKGKIVLEESEIDLIKKMFGKDLHRMI